jgi:hypothetical protein
MAKDSAWLCQLKYERVVNLKTLVAQCHLARAAEAIE